MLTNIFDGKKFAQEKEISLKNKITQVNESLGRKLKLVAVGIGGEKDIASYLSLKEKAAMRLGVDFDMTIFPEDVEEKVVCDLLEKLSGDKFVDSILLELPIPKKFNLVQLVEKISPLKDHDGITPENLGRLLIGHPRYYPATVKAIRDILSYYFLDNNKISTNDFLLENNKKPLAGLNAVVIGGGVELGKPLGLLLSDLGAGVSLLRSSTKDLSPFLKNADLVISATGVPNLILGEHLKEGVVVVDAGISFVEGKVAGDVNLESVKNIASFVTPVPGGVGPVTIVSLFENMVDDSDPLWILR